MATRGTLVKMGRDFMITLFIAPDGSMRAASNHGGTKIDEDAQMDEDTEDDGDEDDAQLHPTLRTTRAMPSSPGSCVTWTIE